MLQAATLSFIKSLAENNNKPWFDAHRKQYEAAKKDFEILVTEVLQELVEMDPEFEGCTAKKSIFRIFRDVRFSKDKTPYKPHLSAGFSPGGKKDTGAGYYLHIEAGGKSFVGGGMWMPDSATLKNIRQELDYNFKDFQKIIEAKAFKKLFPKIEGESLKRPPQGYSEDNAAIDFLKMKSFTVGTKLSDSALKDKNLAQEIVSHYKVMKPFLDFLGRNKPEA